MDQSAYKVTKYFLLVLICHCFCAAEGQGKLVASATMWLRVYCLMIFDKVCHLHVCLMSYSQAYTLRMTRFPEPLRTAWEQSTPPHCTPQDSASLDHPLGQTNHVIRRGCTQNSPMINLSSTWIALVTDL